MLEFVFELSRVIVPNREGRRRMEEKLQFKNFLSVHQSPLKQKKLSSTYVFYFAIFNFNRGLFFLVPTTLERAAGAFLCLYLYFHFLLYFPCGYLNISIGEFPFALLNFSTGEFSFWRPARLKRLQVSFVWRSTEAAASTNYSYISSFIHCTFLSFSFFCRTFKNTLFWGFLQASLGSETSWSPNST